MPRKLFTRKPGPAKSATPDAPLVGRNIETATQPNPQPEIKLAAELSTVAAETASPQKSKAMAAAASSSTGAPRPTANSSPSPSLQEAIRQRAFELYQQRGCSSGHETEDWIQAEREVLQRQALRKRA